MRSIKVTACLLQPDDRRPGQKQPVEMLDALRVRILSDGICAADFAALQAYGPRAFEHVFGACALVKIEFDVAFIGEHSHLVYIPALGLPPQIVTAYPLAGQLRVGGPVAWAESPHSPLRAAGRHQRLAIIETGFSEADWRRVSIVAQAIDEARLNYNFLFQNSNSVVATLAHVAKTGFVDLPGGGLNLGAGNLLYDEMNGGRQVPKLLVRGGMSHSGDLSTPLPGRVRTPLDTDG